MKALKVIGIILSALIVIIIAAGTFVKVALPNTGKAPKIKIERTAERIKRGDYLANHVSVCMDCHSTRDWGSYAGPMIGGLGAGGEKFDQQMGFPGKFYAPNITPYKLANWTDGEIYRALTTGVNNNGKALFPLMPWEHVGLMDREDVYSIIAYLRTLPAINKDVPAPQLDFPVNFIVNTMPHKANPGKLPAESDSVKYGGYLVNAAGCVDCHSKVDHGAKIAGTEFGGGMEFKQPAGVLTSANITPDTETGIGTWTKEMFVQRFKSLDGKAATARKLGKGDVNTVMPWYMYAGMKPTDLGAIYAYLHSLKPIKNKVVKFKRS
ncbi:c-type cytochrome [Mucilaginibacter ginkgonis]|uniref:C-type cytochrome n=1 Tax=Mucilaginibacter ginkgonis TaxID=2682091 RepID=A0A6I4I2K1_9SPHI|nr:c-type cytochrome [Mucilaginibacter ginkgonis]QQL49460.1 c-type cytochrome [Mucilaginibacter ginkgonis]